MKKILVLFGVSALVGIANANLVVNGSFETGPVGVLTLTSVDQVTGWRAFDTSDPDVAIYELVNDAAEATDGANYMKITSTTGASGDDSGLDITYTTSGSVALSTGVTYTVSFDAKRVAGADNSMFLAIRSYEGATTVVENFVGTPVTLTGSWATYSYDITPTALRSDGIEPNLYIGFRPKTTANMLDETIYLDNVQVIPYGSNTLTMAAITSTDLPGVVSGVADDLFQNATITTNIATHEVADIADLFSSGSPIAREDTIFADNNGTTLLFVEFHTMDRISLTNLVIGLGNDYQASGLDMRSIVRVRVYADTTTATMPTNVIASIAVNPEYTDAYGDQRIMLDMDLDIEAQYFRFEFFEPDAPYSGVGGRVYEIDGFGSVLPLPPVEPATFVGWSSVSSNVMRMVVNTPGLTSTYYPKTTTDLVTGSWINVPHSDDGLNAFIVTNLDYSTAEGTNEVIYVNSNDANGFFGIGGQ